MKNSKIKKAILLICIMFAFGSVQQLHAQLPGFGDDVDDAGTTAPINGFVGVALAVGAYFGAKKLKKEK